MRKVIKNGTIIPMNLSEKKIINKDIIIDDNIITSIEENYQGKYDLLIDATNKVVMPGLINCHTHLGMSIFRATNDNLSLNDWLNNKIWPIENNLSTDDIYYSTILSCIEMIKTGSTCANVMYINNEANINGIKKCKIRALFGSHFDDLLGKNPEKGDKIIDNFKRLYKQNKNNNLIKFAIAPHAFYTCSKEYLRKCSDLALQLNLPIHIHFSENLNEVEEIKKFYKKDPVDALFETNLINNKLILAHATFVSDYGLEKLKGKDVSFVHNPVSNLNLGCGIADITKYKKYVNICLGTDGQGSGNNLNLFYHMSMVDFLQKGLYKDSTVHSSYETLKMATINGAKALGMENEIGSIEIGKRADIIILDLDNVVSYPGVDLITNVVHNVESCNVDTTIIDGEILMKDHKLLLDVNESDIKERIEKIINEKITIE